MHNGNNHSMTQKDTKTLSEGFRLCCLLLFYFCIVVVTGFGASALTSSTTPFPIFTDFNAAAGGGADDEGVVVVVIDVAIAVSGTFSYSRFAFEMNESKLVHSTSTAKKIGILK